VPGGWSNLIATDRRATDSAMPFAAIGWADGQPLLDAVGNVQDPLNEDVHVTFSFDENRHIAMYDDWLRSCYQVVVGGLSAAALYKSIVVFSGMMSMSTGSLVLCLEFPSILCLLLMCIKGPLAYEPVSSARFLAQAGAFPFSGMFSKFLVARFWRSYLKGVNGKFVDPVCRLVPPCSPLFTPPVTPPPLHTCTHSANPTHTPFTGAPSSGLLSPSQLPQFNSPSSTRGSSDRWRCTTMIGEGSRVSRQFCTCPGTFVYSSTS